MAEVLSGSAALHELIGPAENLAEALTRLVELFLGKTPERPGDHGGLVALAARFAADELPEARTAIASRIVAEFKSAKRLLPRLAGRGIEGAAPPRQSRGARRRQISQP